MEQQQNFTPIRIVRLNKEFYFSVDDFFSFLLDFKILSPKGLHKWRFLTYVYKSNYQGFQKRYVSNFTVCDFIQLGFTDVYVNWVKVYTLIEDFLPKRIWKHPLIVELQFGLDNVASACFCDDEGIKASYCQYFQVIDLDNFVDKEGKPISEFISN